MSFKGIGNGGSCSEVYLVFGLWSLVFDGGFGCLTGNLFDWGEKVG